MKLRKGGIKPAVRKSLIVMQAQLRFVGNLNSPGINQRLTFDSAYNQRRSVGYADRIPSWRSTLWIRSGSVGGKPRSLKTTALLQLTPMDRRVFAAIGAAENSSRESGQGYRAF